MSDVYCITESKDEANLSMCREIMEYLIAAYPGHPWHVRIETSGEDGVLIIKNMRISPVWSMVRKLSSLAYSAKRRKHDVVMAAGEFLECANMARGKATGETARVLEGRKDDRKFNPMIAKEIMV